MAKVNVTPQLSTQAGLHYSTTSPSTSDSYLFTNAGEDLLHVYNGNASPTAITIKRHATYDGDVVADRVVTVPAGERWTIGPFDPAIYNAKSGDDVNKVEFSFSVATSVTFAVLRRRVS